ncbi:hypothetical protein [Streptomyces bacillaris]|uniref:hypothetical protein n=1 Tax=Streptomyces bacillaris TaxID=68179 RepID=UPI00362D5BF8
MSRRLDDSQRPTVAEHASLDSIREMLAAERHERRRVDSRIGWLEQLLDRRLDQVAAGTWPAPEQPRQLRADARPTGGASDTPKEAR